jgi:hypothetical protein
VALVFARKAAKESGAWLNQHIFDLSILETPVAHSSLLILKSCLLNVPSSVLEEMNVKDRAFDLALTYLKHEKVFISLVSFLRQWLSNPQ